MWHLILDHYQHGGLRLRHSFTFSRRQATHAVILRLMSGSFLSPKESLIAAAADGTGDFELLLILRLLRNLFAGACV